MNESEFRTWLERRGLAETTVDTYVSDARRVERDYGNLDELCAEGRLEEVRQNLPYKSDGNKTALNRYREYRETAQR